MISFGGILSIFALIVSLLSLLIQYDTLIRKLIYHLSTPDVQLIFYPGNSDREDGGFSTRTPEYYKNDKVLRTEFSDKDDEYHILREDLCYSEYTDDDTKFSIAIENSGEKTIDIKNEVFADWEILHSSQILPESLREADIGTQVDIQKVDLSEPISIGPKQKFDFEEYALEPDARRDYGWIIDESQVNGDVVGDYEILLRVSISVNPSEFNLCRWSPPDNIMAVEYGPIEKRVRIVNNEIDPNRN